MDAPASVLLRTDSPPAPPADQMALDATLLLEEDTPPRLRFYRWEAPSLTFGYAQRWRDIVPLVPGGGPARAARRPTGGGIVFHGDDLTFSAAFPAPPAWNPSRLYADLHARLLRTLAGVGYAASTWHTPASSAPHTTNGPLQCFASPVPMDLTTPDGKSKILGGALRRVRTRVLYQGSLRLSPTLPDTPTLRDALAAAWVSFLGCTAVSPAPAPSPSPSLLARYRSDAWLERR